MQFPLEILSSTKSSAVRERAFVGFSVTASSLVSFYREQESGVSIELWLWLSLSLLTLPLCFQELLLASGKRLRS